MAKKPIEDDLLTGGSISSKGDKPAKKSANKPKVNVKISKNTAKVIKSVVCAVVIVALLVTYVATGAVRKGFIASLSLPAQTLTGVTVSNGEQKIKLKVSTYNFYYATTYNSLSSTKAQYEQYNLNPADMGLDVDFDKKLSKQTYTDSETNEVMTWQEHMNQLVLDSIEDTYTYYLAAVEANDGKEPELSAENQESLNSMLDSYRETANKYGYTLSGYLVKAMGKGVTEKVLVTETTRQYIAEEYKNSLTADVESKEYTADDVNAYKDAHLDDLKSADIMIFECENEDQAKEFKDKLNADSSNFADLASEYAVTDFEKTAYKDPAYSTIVGATRASLQSNKNYSISQADPHEHEEGEEHSDDEEATYSSIDWIMSSDRKAGDSYQSSTTVVSIVSPAALQERNTVNVRHILIAPETNDENTAVTDATAQQWDAAYEKAQGILNEWKSGEATEDSFAALVSANSTDTGSSSNGGLYENVVTGQMVNPFSAWCFDSSRSVGDTGIVKTQYGYHIMYFAGTGDEKIWEVNAKQALADEDGASQGKKLEEAYNIKVNWFGSRYFVKDIDIDS